MSNKIREVVLDTETTGLDPLAGHRIVEIGCVEVVNTMPTGRVYHQYLNPERDIPEEAARVHGITNDMVADKPLFRQVAEAFLAFIGDAPLVIHNAAFDMKFINAELVRAKRETLPMTRAIDTVKMARKMFPGGRASLDALCQKFGIDNAHRDKHGALLDAELLADVYLELRGGRQPALALSEMAGAESVSSVAVSNVPKVQRPVRSFAVPPVEQAAHTAFMEKLQNPLWKSLVS